MKIKAADTKRVLAFKNTRGYLPDFTVFFDFNMEQRPESPELINFDDYFYEEEIECERHQDIQPFDHQASSSAPSASCSSTADDPASSSIFLSSESGPEKVKRKRCDFMDTPKQKEEIFRQGKPITRQAQVLIANVVNFCDAEYQHVKSKCEEGSIESTFEFLGSLMLQPLANTYRRASAILNLQERTLYRVLKRAESTQKFETPGKKLTVAPKFHKIDAFLIHRVRQIIHTFFRENKHLTLDILLEKLQEEIDFPYRRYTLWALLKSQGFYFRKRGNRLHLFERNGT